MGALPDNLLESLARSLAEQEKNSPVADQSDVVYFEKQMGSDGYDTMDHIDVVKKAEEIQMSKPGMGDAILNGIENVRTYMKNHSEHMVDSLAELDRDTSMVAALKFQYKIMAHGIYVMSVTKFSDKTSKGIQALFKPQGG